MKLLVVQPIGDRAIGTEITDADEVAAILASEQVSFVVQIADDVPTKPAKTATSAS
jgi:hypothetical protein